MAWRDVDSLAPGVGNDECQKVQRQEQEDLALHDGQTASSP